MDEDAFLSASHVSRETWLGLRTYAALLARWNAKINLVSPSSLGEVWQRHFLDSAQLWTLIDPRAETAVDFGSGAGFPGLVLALIGQAEQRPIHFHLVEADGRKCAFLHAVERELDVRVTMHARRLEVLQLPSVDLVTARAFAPLADLMTHTHRLRKPGGQALFLKGRSVHKELDEAGRLWNFEHRLHPSLTEPQAAVVEIGAIHGPR